MTITDLDGITHDIDIEHPGMTFLHVDCMEVLKALPEKTDLVAIVDPPYGGNIPGHKYIERAGGQLYKYGDRAATEKWDKAPCNEYFDMLLKKTKDQVIWGGNFFDLPPNRCFLVYRKKGFTDKWKMAMAEYAWTSFDKNAKVFEKAPQNPKRIHPTQKPVELYEWILNLFCKNNEVILDTHASSGSLEIACRHTGHEVIGCEINNEYYEKALDRINQETSQSNIYDYT
jgi:site-specific DNA-methyltransferase (adenine-specific)